MVKCESCPKELTESSVNEVEDNKKKLHLICNRCRKLSKLVLDIFPTLEWKAFLEFVKRYDEDHKDLVPKKSTTPIKQPKK